MDKMQIEIFEVEGGFGYRVVDEGRHIRIEQSFKPNVPGFQLMTQVEADQIAAIVVTEITKPVEAAVQQT